MPAGVRFGRTGGWFGSRRASTLATPLGALDHFVKPVNPKELVHRLSELNVKANAGKQRHGERVKEGVLAG